MENMAESKTQEIGRKGNNPSTLKREYWDYTR